MKKLIIIICLTFLSPSIVVLVAKNTSSHYQETTIAQKVAKMTALLTLTADQQVKYKKLLEDTEVKKAALKEKSKTATAEEKKKLQKAFKDNYEAEFKKILTAAQYTKFQALAKVKKSK